MRYFHLSSLAATAALSGCVAGYGGCLVLSPVKHTLTGRIHFKQYPEADGIDTVPMLELDKTAYVYAPAQSRQCLAANEIQLVGVSEFPHSVEEGTRISVDGKLFQQTSAREHTAVLMNVNLVLPLGTGVQP